MSAASIWPSAWRVAGVFMGVGFLAGTGVEAQTPPDGPLTLQQVLTLLQGGVPAERVRALVVPRCVTFEPSEEAMQSALRAAGASAEFVEALVARCGRPAAAERAAAERALAERAAAERDAAERAAAAADLSSEPVFTPFTVPPEITNRDEVIAAMVAAYPPVLRDAGIGGEVRVFFFIAATGAVADVRIDQSSGHEALDRAALAVARVYRFRPARNRDETVPVWVSFPITFQVR